MDYFFISLIITPLFSPGHDLHPHENTISMLYTKIKIVMKMICLGWFILDNIRFHTSLLEQFQTWKFSAHSQINRHGKVYFWILFFLKFFFEHHIHKHILNTFSTNLHLISFQFNWILIPLLSWIGIQFKFPSIYLNSIELILFKCIYCHSNEM